MTTIFRCLAVVAALTAAVVATGCSPGIPASSSPPAAVTGPSGLPVTLRFGDHAVTATLAGTAAATELAVMLPVRLTLVDAWGQAKSGQLSHPVRVPDTAERTLRPVPGGIYYWPDTAALVVYYDDLGQRVPAPGLIRLGTIGAGLAEVAAAGRQVTVHIERPAGTST